MKYKGGDLLAAQTVFSLYFHAKQTQASTSKRRRAQRS